MYIILCIIKIFCLNNKYSCFFLFLLHRIDLLIVFIINRIKLKTLRLKWFNLVLRCKYCINRGDVVIVSMLNISLETGGYVGKKKKVYIINFINKNNTFIWFTELLKDLENTTNTTNIVRLVQSVTVKIWNIKINIKFICTLG